ncbi:hypothetical protein D3C76_1336480 [compost metagenome]
MMADWKLSAKAARPLSSSRVNVPPCTSASTARPASLLYRPRERVAPDALVSWKVTLLVACSRSLACCMPSSKGSVAVPSLTARPDWEILCPPLAANCSSRAAPSPWKRAAGDVDWTALCMYMLSLSRPFCSHTYWPCTSRTAPLAV